MGDDMSESIKVSARFPVRPERLYRAWLDSTEHGRFTGGGADIEPVVGGRFMSWDDYITGMLLQLDAGRRIVMTWRTTEFPETAPDSRLEVLFEAEGDGTRLILIHTDIPQGEGDKAEDGWIDYYFEPMQRYFRKIAAEESQPHPARATAKHAKPEAKRPAKKTAPKKTAAKKSAAKKPATRGKKAVRRKAARVAKKRVMVKLARRAARKSAGRAKVRAGNRAAKRAAKRK
jgi:uncharacterized protein YndB with AHSA1/START domain